MRKKHVVIVVYGIYLLLLFGMASYYQYLNELPGDGRFSARLEEIWVTPEISFF
jgi:hypothetical protein